MRSGTGGRAAARLLTLVALAVAALLGLAPAGAAGHTEHEHAEDGHDVALPPPPGGAGARTLASCGDRGPPWVVHGSQGFSVLTVWTSTCAIARVESSRAYTLRLVSNGQGDVEAFRAAAESAAAQVGSIAGVQIAVAAGTVPEAGSDERQPVRGEILLAVDETSPCDAESTTWVGCGGPDVFEEWREGQSEAVYSGGKIWVRAAYASRSAIERFSLVAHELGHVLGLGHFDDLHAGQVQVMRRYLVSDAGSYRAGDSNGLVHVSTTRPTVATLPAFAISSRGASLRGTVNAGGLATSYRFDYGTTTSYGRSIPVPEGTLSPGSSAIEVSDAVSGLAADTTYHYRLVATNAGGSTATANATFRTAPIPRPATVVKPNGDRHVFYRALNGQLQEWRWDGAKWSHHEIGYAGRLAGNPAAVVTTTGIIEVYYRSNEGQMWRWRLWDDEYQHGGYGGTGVVAGDPAAVPTATGGAEVFYRTATNQLGRWAFNGADYNPVTYSDPSFTLGGDPAAVALPDGSFETAFRTSAGQMGRWRFAGRTSWPQVYGYAGSVVGDPVAIGTGGTSFQAFYRKSTGQLGRWWFSGTAWNPSDWGTNGMVGGDPSVVQTRTGRLEINYRTPAGQVGRYWFDGDAHDGTVAGTGGSIAGDPSAIVTPSGAVSVFYDNAAGDWWDYSYLPGNASSWNFARLQPAPLVTVDDAVDVGIQQARLRGTVNPRGLSTRWTFQLGTTTRYTLNAPVDDGDAGSGNGPVAVSAVAGRLLAGTTYHYRLVATSAMGTVYSEDRTFRTAPLPKPSVVVRSDGDKHVFYRALNGQLGEWHWDGTTWRNHSYGYAGAVAGNPTAVVTEDDVIEVFHRRAADGELHRWRLPVTGWNEYTYDDAGALSGDPTAIATGGERVEVFASTSLRQLGRWRLEEDDADYDGYGYQGNVIGTPSVAEASDGVLDVVHRSGLDQLWRWTFFGTGHNDNGYGHQGAVTSNPSIVGTAAGVLNSVHRMSTGQLGRWTFFDGGSNDTGYGDAGSVVGDPSAVAIGGGAFESFHRTANGQLGRWWIGGGDREWNPSTWGATGSVAGDPTAIRLADGTLNVFHGRPDAGYAFHEFGRSGWRYVPIG